MTHTPRRFGVGVLDNQLCKIMHVSYILFAVWIGLGVISVPRIHAHFRDERSSRGGLVFALVVSVLVMGPVMFWAAYVENLGE